MKKLYIFFTILSIAPYNLSAMSRAHELALSAQQVAEIVYGLEQQLITMAKGNYQSNEVSTVIHRYMKWTDTYTLHRKVPGTTYTFAELIQQLKAKYNLP